MILSSAAFAFGASTAHAAADGTFFGYNLGINYEISKSYAQIAYDSPIQSTMPKDCEPNQNVPGAMRCQAYLGPDNTTSSYPSIYLEAPFKRQGLLYFETGLTFATIEYVGGLASKPAGPSGGAKGSKPDTGPDGPPLQKAYLDLFGINWQGYARVGITPRYLPDLFVSAGAGIQTAYGTIKVLTSKYKQVVVQPDVFGSVELVIARFHTGSFAVYAGVDQSIAGQLGTQLIPDNPSGSSMSNFRLSLIGGASGIRLLLPF